MGKFANYVAASRSVNCPRLSFNVIHQFLHSGWTVLLHPVLQIPPHRSVTVEELIDNIERETWAIGTATGRRVIENFARCIMACIRRNGEDLDHILDAHT